MMCVFVFIAMLAFPLSVFDVSLHFFHRYIHKNDNFFYNWFDKTLAFKNLLNNPLMTREPGGT